MNKTNVFVSLKFNQKIEYILSFLHFLSIYENQQFIQWVHTQNDDKWYY